jgi:predicted Zn-dependent protease
MIPIRGGLVALALLAAGWLAVQERVARAETELSRIAFDTRAPLTPERVARADELLETARRLNPDRRPDLIEAFLLNRRDRQREAMTLLRGTVRDEPRSLEAWALLAQAADAVDPQLAAAARARARELAPRVPED